MTNELTIKGIAVKNFYETPYAVISFLPLQKIAICTVKTGYIPIADFKELFNKSSELVKQEDITKFIFDKRKLTAFHQPSMEWYHLVWKEDMYNHGLTSHRKLLSEDKLFEQSVITGKNKIAREHPEFKFSKYDIIYCKTIEEAIEK